MLYLNKFLTEIKKNSNLLKSKDYILKLGISSTQIKELKKYALENQFIKSEKAELTVTALGEQYLLSNPLKSWKSKEFPLRPDINLEYLKDEKTPAILTKAIRNLSKHLIDGNELKQYSIEDLLCKELKKCHKLYSMIETEILNGNRISLNDVYAKYISLGITKSLIAIIILQVLLNNKDVLAIYEKTQFQLNFNHLMFDRMIACPENFEIQKTEIYDIYILKDISKIILNKSSNNILEITKGLYSTIKKLDKYTMNTEKLSKNTLRFRTIVLNAKDPISLFQRDIPKVFGINTLKDGDRKFLNDLKITLNELKNSTEELLKELKEYIFETFNVKTRNELSERFIAIKDYIGEQDLKILYNTITELNVNDELWINRIATFINKSRVPKDWNDKDYIDFKIKAKELALIFSIIEATIGTKNYNSSKNYNSLIKNFTKFSKPEKLTFLREVLNLI